MQNVNHISQEVLHIFLPKYDHIIHIGWHFALSPSIFTIDLFRLINISYLVLFQWLPNIQLCRYDMIYVIIPLLNSISFLHRLAIVKMLH